MDYKWKIDSGIKKQRRKISVQTYSLYYKQLKFVLNKIRKSKIILFFSPVFDKNLHTLKLYLG